MEEPELESPKPKRDHGLNIFIRKADQVADEVGNLWQLDAACSSEDPDLWFPLAGRTVEVRANTKKAVNICFNECPVRLQCLKAACVGREPSGIWGGLDHSTRRGDNSPSRRAHDYEALSRLTNPYGLAESEAEDR